MTNLSLFSLENTFSDMGNALSKQLQILKWGTGVMKVVSCDCSVRTDWILKKGRKRGRYPSKADAFIHVK